MNPQDRIRLFDDWASHYDQSIQGDGGFPFDGYEQVLDEIARVANVRRGMKVLDLGIGTGNLAARFASLGCDVWGIDFSAEMLAQVSEKLPGVVLAQADLLSGWPPEFNRRFDRVVSAYVLHEFDLSTKIKLLERLVEHNLVTNGRIVIGDIAFPTSKAQSRAHRKWAKLWDKEEHYWAADETAQACGKARLQIAYKQISSCGGVFVFEAVSP